MGLQVSIEADPHLLFTGLVNEGLLTEQKVHNGEFEASLVAIVTTMNIAVHSQFSP